MRRLLPALLLPLAFNVAAKDVITQRTVGMELARDLAQAAVEACRADGWQVTAVVVNRAGDSRLMNPNDQG